MITGKDLIEKGYKPGKWFADALEAVNNLPEGADVWQIIEGMKPEEIPVRPLKELFNSKVLLAYLGQVN